MADDVALAADAATGEVDAGELEEDVTPGGSGWRLAGVGCEGDEGRDGGAGGERELWIGSGLEETARHRELGVDVGGSKQAEVAALDRAPGQGREPKRAG